MSDAKRYRPDTHGELFGMSDAILDALDGPCPQSECNGRMRNRTRDGGRTVYAWCRKCGVTGSPLVK